MKNFYFLWQDSPMGQAPQAPPQEQELLPFFFWMIFPTMMATTAAMIKDKIMMEGQFIFYAPFLLGSGRSSI